MALLELKIPPIIVVGLVALGMWIVTLYFPPLMFPFHTAAKVGIGIFSVGAVTAVLGMWEFIKVKTTMDPRYPDKASQLVVAGIYQLSRNPMYLGFLLMLAGWVFYLNNIIALLWLPIFVLFMNRFQIQPEERYMAQKFGQQFVNYAAKVRRWI